MNKMKLVNISWEKLAALIALEARPVDLTRAKGIYYLTFLSLETVRFSALLAHG